MALSYKKLEQKIENLELKLEQQTQDYHFDMRNKQMEIVMLENRLLKLEMKNAELKDIVLDCGEEYKED